MTARRRAVLALAAAVPLAVLMLFAPPVLVRPPVPAPPPGPTVDGVELGTPAECEPTDCAILDGVATAWLDRATPGHAPVAAISRYGYPVRDTNGDLYPYPGSAPIFAEVMTIQDGTERATLVVCGMSCWQADPFRVAPPPESP